MAEKEYIEAKDLDDFRNEIMDKFLSLCNYNDYNKLTLLRIGETIDKVYDKYVSKPLDDVVEVKHGEWFLLDECSNEGVYCSVCTKKVYRTEYANQKLKSNYCPNCGAKMNGERKEK